MHRRIFEIGTVDPQLNCPNMRKFEEDLSVLLSQNKVTRFAVVLLRISNFAYIPEHFGEPMARRLLKYTRNLCQRALLMREAYAYSTDGEFALLLHYKNRDALMSRLSALRFSFDRFSGFGQSGYKAKLVFDIYEIDRTKPQQPHRIIEKAMTIRDMPTEEGSSFTDFRFYSDVVRETYLKRAEIEGRMEEALKNSEFHLFYQPKYSFKKQGIDGSEVLVRWFDARKNAYRSPDLFLPVFEEMGCSLTVEKDRVRLKAPEGRLRAVKDVRTMPYPGFPTDAQAPVMALSALADGTSVFVENIFESRYKHASELARMGAHIKLEGRVALVEGTEKLYGAPVAATDLRGGAALVVAGLAAEGQIAISEIRHIDRGYERIEEALIPLGAKIRREAEN